MDEALKNIIEKSKVVKGAITFKRINELRPNMKVYVTMDAADCLLCIEGMIKSVDAEQQSFLFAIPPDLTSVMPMPLALFNGHSDIVGEEKDSNYSRVFLDVQLAIEYLEQIKFIRETNPKFFVDRLKGLRK